MKTLSAEEAVTAGLAFTMWEKDASAPPAVSDFCTSFGINLTEVKRIAEKKDMDIDQLLDWLFQRVPKESSYIRAWFEIGFMTGMAALLSVHPARSRNEIKHEQFITEYRSKLQGLGVGMSDRDSIEQQLRLVGQTKETEPLVEAVAILCDYARREHPLLDDLLRSVNKSLDTEADKKEERGLYCPSCGKRTPENSRFCPHCGTRIDTPGVRPVTQWEYRDFVYTYPEGKGPWRACGSRTYRRQDIWNEQQMFLLPKLQEWLDEGWEPITEVGVGALEWEYFTKFFSLNPLDSLFLRTYKCERLVVFRVKMRRLKR